MRFFSCVFLRFLYDNIISHLMVVWEFFRGLLIGISNRYTIDIQVVVGYQLIAMLSEQGFLIWCNPRLRQPYTKNFTHPQRCVKFLLTYFQSFV